MAGSHYNVTNLTVFVDRNMLMIDGPTEEVMGLEPFDEKWKAFGWNVLTIDGHDYDEIVDAVKASHITTDKPTVVIAKTAKGKGVDFMENDYKWHYAGLDSEAREKALESIRRS